MRKIVATSERLILQLGASFFTKLSPYGERTILLSLQDNQDNCHCLLSYERMVSTQADLKQ